MTELSIAYLFAIGLIAGMLLLARRNFQQGWRKQRTQWLDIQANAAIRAFEAKPASSTEPLQHLADLDRLRQSLDAHNEPAPQPVPVEAHKKEKRENLVPSR